MSLRERKKLVIGGINHALPKAKHAVGQNRSPDKRLLAVLAPCFKRGGFDIYANRDIAGFLNAALPHFGFRKPVLISFGPVRIGKQTGYAYKILPRVKGNGNLHK